jgi:trans-aconitate 3-methyltransferase
MAQDNNPFAEQDEAFWSQYMHGRPRVPSSFFDQVFRYHESHGGRFDIAHDVGAGPGVHCHQLARQFNRVRVSDASSHNVDMAEQRLRDTAGTYEFVTAPIQNVDTLERESVDLVHAGVMLHFAPISEAIEAVLYQLRPGGTFVATLFGHIILVDNKEVESLMHKLYHRGFESRLQKLSAEGAKRMCHSVSVVQSGYDNVPLSTFEPGALRLRLNFEHAFATYNACGPSFSKADAAIGAADVVREERADGWRYTTDLAGLRATLDSLTVVDFSDQVVQELWSRLETAAGDQKLEVTWPANVIMATKPRNTDDQSI